MHRHRVGDSYHDQLELTGHAGRIEDRFLDEQVGLYPGVTPGGNGRERYVDVEAVRACHAISGHRAILHEAWERYRTPVALTEVHLGSTREEQMRWLLEASDSAHMGRSECRVRAAAALAAANPWRAPGDQRVSPTYVPDLVNVSLDLLIDGASGIWHQANEGDVSWSELARKAAAALGYAESGVDECATAALRLAAVRPAYSVLGTERGQRACRLSRMRWGDSSASVRQGSDRHVRLFPIHSQTTAIRSSDHTETQPPSSRRFLFESHRLPSQVCWRDSKAGVRGLSVAFSAVVPDKHDVVELSSADLDGAVHHGYPRPQLQRHRWISLNGDWDFALDHGGRFARPRDVHWDRTIVVPFSPETPRSGVHDTGFYKACWYRRIVALPSLRNGERLLLHFGAVDHTATVWIDGALACSHEGGYTPFMVDLTDFITLQTSCEIVIRAEDDPADLTKPRGKQDWQLEPHSIWYPRTTGIWQTVWMERVPPTRIDVVRWSSSLERWDIGFEARIAGEWRDGLRLGVRLEMPGGSVVGDDTYTLTSTEVVRRIALSDPGIDDSRNELLWSPSSPTLIAVRLQLWADRGELLDEAESYTALRSVSIQGDRFLLNGRPFPLRLVLDQGYWEGTGITAPNDDALQRDVQLARAMGFNGVRKHQKVEDPRYLYWADRLGLLVWEEMPSAYRFTWNSVQRLTQEWTKVLERDVSHPCIVGWVPFNESWGAPNLPQNPAERHYIRSVYHLTKTLDPTRPVIGNDGWESVATDIIGIHDYDSDPARIALRYHADEVLPRLFRRERPGGRLLVLEGQPHSEHPIVLSEFGGIAYSTDPNSWGYSCCTTAEELCDRYSELLRTVRALDLLSGFCYTQFADTYQEANGLLYADRRPKFPIAAICAATRGTNDRPRAGPVAETDGAGVEASGRRRG